LHLVGCHLQLKLKHYFQRMNYNLLVPQNEDKGTWESLRKEKTFQAN